MFWRMNLKQEILEIPQALRETLEKGRPEYEALVRKTRWGDGPIYVVGRGSSFLSALTATYAFQGLLGWPVIVYPTAVFMTYALTVLRPHSVLLVLANRAESEEVGEVARAARSRGATVLALIPDLAGSLAQMMDGAFLLRVGGDLGSGAKFIVCEQAGLCFISLIAARVLKRHHPLFDALEQEFEKLPELVEQVFSQMTDAVRSVASEMEGAQDLRVVGAGFYHPVALQAARLMMEITRKRPEGFDPCAFDESAISTLNRNTVVAFLSGSRCKLKRKIHGVAAGVRKAGAKIIAVTDSNDRELIGRSTVSVLLPTLTEMVGSTLTLALLAWVTYHVARKQGRARLAPGPELEN